MASPTKQSKVLTGQRYEGEWHLRGTNEPYNLDLLPVDDGCAVKCEKITLTFQVNRLEENVTPGKQSNWLSLCVTAKKSESAFNIGVWFKLRIQKLDAQGNQAEFLNDDGKWKGFIVSTADKRAVIIPHFIKISTIEVDGSSTEEKQTTTYPKHDPEYRLQFQVELDPAQNDIDNDTISMIGWSKKAPKIARMEELASNNDSAP